MPTTPPRSPPAVLETSPTDALSLVIEQNDCPDCGSPLNYSTYKENPAVVCTECDTPVAQLWRQ